MEFGLLVTDIPVYVPCKFEMYIFKVALVISENVRIAFLYVPSIIYLKWYFHQLRGNNSLALRARVLIFTTELQRVNY